MPYKEKTPFSTASKREEAGEEAEKTSKGRAARVALTASTLDVIYRRNDKGGDYEAFPISWTDCAIESQKPRGLLKGGKASGHEERGNTQYLA